MVHHYKNLGPLGANTRYKEGNIQSKPEITCCARN